MSTIRRNKSAQDDYAAIARSIEALIARDDSGDPPGLDDADREALRVVLRIVAESDAAFRAIRLQGDPLACSYDADYLCDTIRSGIDFYAVVKQSAAILEGVCEPDVRSMSVIDMLDAHRQMFQRLQDETAGLSERVSLLLGLIRIELLFFAHVW